MATITSNGTGGGNWGTAATWAGAAVPVDNDTVVIAAGDTVTFDVDTSAWANGIAGITITSDATTPAACTASSGTAAAGSKARRSCTRRCAARPSSSCTAFARSSRSGFVVWWVGEETHPRLNPA